MEARSNLLSPRCKPESRFGLLLALFLIACSVARPIPVAAQAGPEDVHINPRQILDSRTISGVQHDMRLHARSVVKNVDLVLVPVTVADDLGRPVTGLEKRNFALYEAQARQEVRYFSMEDAPITIGILFDTSSSMSDKIEEARQSVVEFLKTTNPLDEFFVISFSDRPVLISDFSNSPEDIASKLMLISPEGSTALHDAVYLGLTKASQGRYSRRALLIISDGGDNHSRYSEREVMNFAKEADTPIYAVGIHWAAKTSEEHRGAMMLAEMTEATGGRHFTIERLTDLADVTTKIGYLLRNQYVLGYRPLDAHQDGKWHKIKVKLDLPQGSPHATAYAKTGYYASTE